MHQPFLLHFSEKCIKKEEANLKDYMNSENKYVSSLKQPPDHTYYSQVMSCYQNHVMSLQIGIDRPHPGMTSRNKISKVLLLHFVIGGKGTIDGIPFSRGTAFYTKRYIPYTLMVDSEDPWFLIWVAVDGLQADKLSITLNEISENQMTTISDPDALLQLVRFWMYDMSHTSATYGLYEGMLPQLLSFLIPKNAPEPTEEEAIPQRLRRMIHQSTQYIENNLSTVTVAELAKQANFEHTYFTRIFTAVKGISPKEYILNTKMEIAKHYLTVTNYSIEEINFLLGYTHRNSLTALFKKKYGTSPQEFRAQNKQNS